MLQLWRKDDGKLLYERKLSRVPKGWGVHGKKFFYQESDYEDDSFEIFMLELDNEDKMHIRKLELPNEFKKQQKNSQVADNQSPKFRLLAGKPEGRQPASVRN